MVVWRVMVAMYALSTSIALGAVIGTIAVLPCALLRTPRQQLTAIKGASFWARLVVEGVLWTHVRQELVQMPRQGEGVLMLCNHRSWLDPLLLMARTQSNGLSKREVFYIPFIGLYAKLSGAVFFDRRSLASRARARREVRELVRMGCRIQLFPEGTRRVEEGISEKAHLLLCKDCFDDGISVWSCAVTRSDEVLPARKIAAHLGKTVDLYLGSVHRPEDYEDADTFAKACWQETVDAYHRMVS